MMKRLRNAGWPATAPKVAASLRAWHLLELAVDKGVLDIALIVAQRVEQAGALDE